MTWRRGRPQGRRFLSGSGPGAQWLTVFPRHALDKELVLERRWIGVLCSRRHQLLPPEPGFRPPPRGPAVPFRAQKSRCPCKYRVCIIRHCDLSPTWHNSGNWPASGGLGPLRRRSVHVQLLRLIIS
ncbi:hypothetical protein Zmor_000042 [Zophobas morio]|uniref:Uncharacterized protein n=1 Tax=Zophobas morio TaxID=2755281 RepID=A0AA38MR20_9CUCU|nr:hypothetical protein Zmor_000042 [Zophobas morio]